MLMSKDHMAVLIDETRRECWVSISESKAMNSTFSKSESDVICFKTFSEIENAIFVSKLCSLSFVYSFRLVCASFSYFFIYFFFYALFRIFLAYCTFLSLKSKGKEDYCWNAKLCTHTTKKVKPKNEQYLNKTSNNTHNKLTLFLISEFATLDISIVVIIIMY